jgi:membrane protein YqaA with SNARE-associated domain
MILLLTTLGVCALSALVPLVNAEAYLAAVATQADHVDLWMLGLVAAAGQMVGKVLWYDVGRRSMRWSWIERRMATPKRQRQLATWRDRAQGRPVYAGLVLFASAFVGIPPFAVTSVAAGQLAMSFPLFLATGFAGRAARFLLILEGVALIVLW